MSFKGPQEMFFQALLDNKVSIEPKGEDGFMIVVNDADQVVTEKIKEKQDFVNRLADRSDVQEWIEKGMPDAYMTPEVRLYKETSDELDELFLK